MSSTENKCFAADGVTPTYTAPGLPIMVSAVDFNRVYGKLLAATSTMPADGVKDPFVIYLDADPIDVGQVYRAKGFQFLPPNPTMSGAEIRSCGWKKNNYQMYIDATPMQPVGDTEAIPLKSGMKFFCIPEANW